MAAQTDLIYTARDADGDYASLTFTVKIDGTPDFGAQTIAAQAWMLNQAIAALQLPQAADGNGTITYSLGDSSGNLPDGLSFDASTRSITGTPTVAAQTDLIYTARDTDGDSASLTFTVKIDGATSFGGQTVAAQVWTLNQAIAALPLPEAANGNGAISYSLGDANGELPDGLSFDADNRSITGTPTVLSETTLTYTARDADGDSASLTFTVKIDGTPDFGAQTIAAQVWTLNQAIAALQLPQAADGNGATTYSLGDASGELPDGLSFDADTRMVTGTPTVPSETTLTYTATDADGDSASLTFTVKIDGATSFGGQTVAAQVWTLNMAIAALQLPQAADGNGAISYSLGDANGELPDGLSFDASTRSITGTPTVAAQTTLTYTATDADGDSASLTFTVKIDGTTSFGGQTVAAQVWTLNQAIVALPLPEAVNGNGAITYSLGDTNGELPNWPELRRQHPQHHRHTHCGCTNHPDLHRHRRRRRQRQPDLHRQDRWHDQLRRPNRGGASLDAEPSHSGLAIARGRKRQRRRHLQPRRRQRRTAQRPELRRQHPQHHRHTHCGCRNHPDLHRH